MMRALGVLLACVWLLTAPAQAATTIFDDTFTGGAGALTSHTPDTGTSWTALNVSGVSISLDGSGSISDNGPGAATYAYYTANATYPTADYDVTVTFSAMNTACATTRMAGILGRIQDASNYYLAWIECDASATNAIRIYKVVAGTSTKISGAEDVTSAANDIYVFEFRGSAIGLKRNGSYVINPITDTAISAAGKAGYGVGDFGTETGAAAPGSNIAATQFTVNYTPAGTMRRKPVVFQ